jgi:hypothetical protein
MPNIWISYAEEVLGYVPEQTPNNEEYVAAIKIQKWLNLGHDVDNIARLWNQGSAGPCIVGINDQGVPYDSCKYEQVILAYYR